MQCIYHIRNQITSICIAPHKCPCQRKLCIECLYNHGVDIANQTVLINKFKEMAIKKLKESQLDQTSKIAKQRQTFKQLISQTENTLKKIWDELQKSIQNTYDWIEQENNSYSNLINENTNLAESSYADLERLVSIIEETTLDDWNYKKNQFMTELQKIQTQWDQDINSFIQKTNEVIVKIRSINQKENIIKNQNQNLPNFYPGQTSDKIDQINDFKIQKIKTQEDCIKQSKLIRKNGNIQILQFPNYAKYFAQQPNEIKTILIIGPCGVGKTSVINSILNYHFQIQFEDNYRFIFSDTKSRFSNLPQSEIITYYIPPFNDKPELLIIEANCFKLDEKDETSLKEILNFLITQMKYITLICFVFLSVMRFRNQNDLSKINKLQQIFGLNFIDNSIFAFSFCDSGEPSALNLIFKGNEQMQENPFAQMFSKFGKKLWIKLNNFENDKNDDYDDYDAIFWKINMKSLEKLYHKIKFSTQISCQVFKQNQNLII